MTEIKKDYFCSGDFWNGERCSLSVTGNCIPTCQMRNCKYPTPEQFFAEYEREWPDDGAVYILNDGAWFVAMYHAAKNAYRGNPVVCACTPFGKPSDDWRPE